MCHVTSLSRNPGLFLRHVQPRKLDDPYLPNEQFLSRNALLKKFHCCIKWNLQREREREFLDTGHHVPTTCDYFVKENNMDLDYERKFPFGKNMLYFK